MAEMNPNQDDAARLHYKKTPGTSLMTGELFEIKMATLLFLRALGSGHPFHIASNVAAAGSFDDLVFTLGHQTAFLQLKHKSILRRGLSLSQILFCGVDFNLLKYFQSYVNIKEQWQTDDNLQCFGKFEDSLYVIFTNAPLLDSVNSNFGCSEIHDLLNTRGKSIQFTKQHHADIYDLFENLPRYRQLLYEAINNGDEITKTPELLEMIQKLQNKNSRYIPTNRDLISMFKCLESIKDLSCSKEYLSQLFFYSEQTGEDGLDTLIRHELNHLFGNDAGFLELRTGVENWWRKSNVFLAREAEFFQDMIKKIAANFTKDISALKFKFVEKECDNIRRKLTPSNRMLHVHTECAGLSSAKILQSFQTNLLIDVRTWYTRLTEVLAVWRLGMCDVLVVEGEITDTNILHQLASTPDPKCLVIISGSGQSQLYQQFEFVSFADTFCLSQLDLNSLREILESEVIFQGFPVKLNSLAGLSFFETAITADVLVQMHYRQEIGQKLDDMDSRYLPQTFVRKEFVTEQIFREEDLTLAVTGVSVDSLAHLEQNGEETKKFNQRSFGTAKACRHFLIEREIEFAELCGVYDSIHWIKACDGSFRWIKSKGDISPVIKHLEHKPASYDAKEIMALPHQVVLIAAEPGMGKSTEMCNIFHMIKQNNPITWVIMAHLNEHTNLLNRDQIGAVEFLETVAALKTQFQKQLFEHELQSNGNVVIVLDGFGEINRRYSEKMFSLLREFSHIRVNKIFVTSCPNLSQQLQQKLSTLAFSFQGFRQENFLARCWRQSCDESSRLCDFSSKLLQLVNASFNGKWKEFIGFPLLCRILVTVFQEEAIRYSETGELRLPESLDVLQLYDMFIDKSMPDVVEPLKRQMQHCLMCSAMVSYLDSDIRTLNSSYDILKQNDTFIVKLKGGEITCGIVTVTSDKLIFVHHSFAEYFVAKWYSEFFHLESTNLEEVFFDKYFDTVRHFLNRILAQEFKLHTAVYNKDVFEIKNLLSEQNANVNEYDKGGRTALHLAVMNYFYGEDSVNDSILNILLEHDADVNSEDKVLKLKPLRLSEKIRAWSVVDKLLEKQADTTDLVWIRSNVEEQQHEVRDRGLIEFEIGGQYHMSDSLQDVMYLALSEGHAKLVESILNCGVSVRHSINGRCGNEISMLHVAAEHGQLVMVQFLIEKGAVINPKNWLYEKSPLMLAVESGHVEVAKLLINSGASVNAVGNDGNTPLSLAARGRKYEVVDLLLQNTCYDVSVLIWQAGHGDTGSIQSLIKNRIVNSQDDQGYTALSVAALVGKSEIVRLLLKESADVDKSDKYDRTPIMWAAEYGHLEVVELLINHEADVNKKDSCGETALSLAATWGKHEVVDLLLQKGADVEVTGKCRRTPLMQAAVRGHVQIVKLLMTRGASVKARDKCGNSVRSLLALGGKLEILKLMLRNVADADVRGEYNRTLLMQAAVRGHLQTVELLINRGASVNARDVFGYTALSLAARKKYKNITRLLLRHGADK